MLDKQTEDVTVETNNPDELFADSQAHSLDRAPTQPPREDDEGLRIDAAFDSIALSTARIVGSRIVPIGLPIHYPPTQDRRENNIQLLETSARFMATLAAAIEEQAKTKNQLTINADAFREGCAATLQRMLPRTS